MKQLALIRHGSCTGGVLNTDGIAKMRLWQDFLRVHFRPYSVFTSGLPDAQESSAMLIMVPGSVGTLTYLQELDSDGRTEREHDQLLALLERATAERVVVVTHYEWLLSFPRYLRTSRGWQLDKSLPIPGYGDALIVDFDRRTCDAFDPITASV